MRKTAFALVLAVSASLPIAAQGAGPLPFYLGAGAGASRVDLDDVNRTLASSFGGFSASTDDGDAGYRIFGGWRPLPWLALEGGWMDLGKATFNATTTLPATRVDGRLKTNAWFVDVVPTYSWDAFAVFAKLGVAFWEVKTNATTDVLLGQRVSGSRKERGESFTWGVGGAWDFAERWVARLEYEQFEAGKDASGKADAALVFVSVAYRF